MVDISANLGGCLMGISVGCQLTPSELPTDVLVKCQSKEKFVHQVTDISTSVGMSVEAPYKILDSHMLQNTE